MQHKKIPIADTKAFSPFFIDYLEQKHELKPFYHRFPLIENFKDQLSEKSTCFPDENRRVLTSVLLQQYHHLRLPEAVAQNIKALNDSKTFTITTGHQLNIFTGPLYFIFKIVTVINACRQLKQKYPDYHFVPVYWMASEDHDYDEIKYFHLYDKKYVWETIQNGPVGKFSTEGFEKLLQQIPGDITIFREAYLKNKNLSDAARHYVNALFGNEGLVVLDSDDHNLKTLLKPVIREDVLRNSTVQLVNKTNSGLQELGYKTQVFCRDINFFYLDKGIRSRIEKHDGRFSIVDTSINFTETELEKIIQDEPEKFSPNVILRPLYQEIILPNLAYVGGPAENIYWLQLKSVFDYFRIPFPMLMPRNFAMIVDHTIERKIAKIGLDWSQLFEDKNYLFNHWTLRNSKHDLTVGAERTTIMEVYATLKKKAESIDLTLGPFVGAEGARVINSLERIERKFLRAEKRLHSDKLRQIEAVKDALFPGGNLQERVDNFLNFYQRDNQFISKLIKHLDAFEYQFNILTYTA